MIKHYAGVCIAFLLMATGATAQLNVAAVNTAYTVTFDATVAGVSNGVFNGSGFQPTPTAGRLDSDAWASGGWSETPALAFGGTKIVAGDFRRGTTAPGNAAVATGGIYSFGGAGITGRAIGVQPNATDFTPGNITLRVQNTTGSTLTAFDLAYNVYYRNDQNSSSEFNLSYSTDDVTYTTVPSQDVVSPGTAAGAAWVPNARGTTINGVSVATGQYFYIRWRGADVVASTAWDEFALDDISVTGRVYTMVRLTSATSTVNESIGTTTITASITNPHPSNPTSVDLALTSGPAARVNGFTTQTITFPGGSTANQTVTITVTDNGACDGAATEVFTLQNITGGLGISAIGTPSAHTMTVQDDDSAPASWAQAFDGGLGDTWSITAGAGNVSTAVGAADIPANQRVLSGTSSWQVTNSVATLQLAPVDVTDWFGTLLSMRLSSTASSGNGADFSDQVKVYVALNGGAFPATPDLTVTGVSNARWGYSSGTGVASTTAGTPVTFTPAAGGNRTTDGYSTINIIVPNGTTSVELKVVANNNVGGEHWSIDNVGLAGTLCSSTYFSRSNGSETTATWSTSRTGLPAPAAVTFNKNKGMVVQNGHTVTTTSNANIHVRNFTTESGGTTALAGITTLTAHGPTFKVDGTLTASDDNVALVSSSLTTVSGSSGTIEVNDLTCDGGGVLVTINTLKVRGTLQLNNGNFNANGKEVQLLSTATGTARLGPVAATASYSDRLRIERYIPAGVTDWRLLASPMAGKTVVDWTDDFYTAGFPGSSYPNFYSPPGSGIFWPSVRMYDETNAGLLDSDGLIGVPSVTQPLTIGRGFAAWSGTTLSTTTAFTIDVRGVPTIASTPFSIPMSYTNSPASAAVDGLNLVGNPLPSPIDFTAVSRGADVDNGYYIYDPGSGTNAAWDETTLIGTGGANGNIQSSQGFWLHCTGPANTVTVTESAKVLEPINGGIFSDVIDQRPLVRLKLNGADMDHQDEAVIHFISGTPDFGAPDMIKLAFGNDAAARISTVAPSGEDLVINALGELTGAIDVPVRVTVPVSGTYTITLSGTQVAAGRACMVLEDLLNGNSTPVVDGATYSFELAPGLSTDPARFVLHVSTPVSTLVQHATCASANDGSITVQGPGPGTWSYTIVDPQQNVTNVTADAAHTFNGLTAGEYSLYVEGNTGCGALVSAIRIEAPSVLAGEAAAHPASCAAALNGSAELTLMGGTAPYSVEWSNGATEQNLSGVEAGSYAATITDANGCVAHVNDVTITSAEAPVAAFSVGSEFPMPGESVAFFNDGTYGLEYTWDLGDGTITSETEFEHVYSEPSMYTVTLTATDGACVATHTMDLQVGLSTGVAETNTSGMNAWAEGSQFLVQWQVEGANGIKAEVLDATGRTMIVRNAKGGMGRVSIPVQDLPTGVYFVRLTAGNGERTVKLPVTR